MSAREETTYSSVMLARVREFLRADPKLPAPMAKDERAKVRALCGDLNRLEGSAWMPVAPGFGRIFSGFERLASVLVQPRPRSPDLPALDDAAMKRAARIRRGLCGVRPSFHHLWRAVPRLGHRQLSARHRRRRAYRRFDPSATEIHRFGRAPVSRVCALCATHRAVVHRAHRRYLLLRPDPP